MERGQLERRMAEALLLDHGAEDSFVVVLNDEAEAYYVAEALRELGCIVVVHRNGRRLTVFPNAGKGPCVGS